jgi:uncharacterized membrane protein
MKANSFIDVLAGVVTVAMITAVVSSKNTAAIITASGTAFRNVIRGSLGK